MSITQSLHRGKNLCPDKLAIVTGDRTTTYGELYNNVATCASVLSQSKTQVGDRVCILALNSDLAITSFWGASWAGMVPNFLNLRWSVYELSMTIDDCTPSVLIVDDIFLKAGVELKSRCASIQRLIYVGDSLDLPEEVESYNQQAAKAQPMEDRSGSNTDLCLLNYTGGTTGKGKGVMISHQAHINSMQVVLTEGLFQTSNTLLVVPLFHVAGICLTSSALMQQSTIFTLAQFEPVTVLENLQKNRIEQAFLVPTMMKMLVDEPTFSDYNIESFKRIRYGASPIDDSLLNKVKASMPWADLMQVYGQTECVPVTVLQHADHSEKAMKSGRTRSAGRPCYGAEFEIRDPEGNPLPAGEIGEIAVSAANMMTGYWNNEKETNAVIKGRWLLTGDAGYLSEDGYLYLVDRMKDMIISGGENVYSLEVESALYKHGSVQDCAVVGLKDKKWGEIVHAEVVLKPNTVLTKEQLIEYTREFLAGYKLPRSVSFTDAIPLTAVGKINKVAIRDKYAN